MEITTPALWWVPWSYVARELGRWHYGCCVTMRWLGGPKIESFVLIGLIFRLRSIGEQEHTIHAYLTRT